MGTNDPTCAAYITRLEAHWMIDMGEFETAEAALDECLTIYRQAGMVGQQAIVLVKMGIAIGYVDAARGVARIREALPLIDGERTPRTMLCAQHDLAWFLADAGENHEALDVLDSARSDPRTPAPRSRPPRPLFPSCGAPTGVRWFAHLR